MFFIENIIIIICINLILTQSFNLIFGIRNLFNLAHISLFCISSYSTAILTTLYNFSFLNIFLITIFITLFFSIFIIFLHLRLNNNYFAIGTLAFYFLIDSIIKDLKITGGMHGITNIVKFGFLDKYFFIIVLLSTIFILFLIFILFNNAFSKNIKSSSQNYLLSQLNGQNVNLESTILIFITTIFISIAGFFFAYHLTYIDPSSFKINEMIIIITYVLIGKKGSFWGVFCSTFFLIILKELFRFLPLPILIRTYCIETFYILILFGFLYFNKNKLKINLRKF